VVATTAVKNSMGLMTTVTLSMRSQGPFRELLGTFLVLVMRARRRRGAPSYMILLPDHLDSVGLTVVHG
jgi:hypothetical protein